MCCPTGTTKPGIVIMRFCCSCVYVLGYAAPRVGPLLECTSGHGGLLRKLAFAGYSQWVAPPPAEHASWRVDARLDV